MNKNNKNQFLTLFPAYKDLHFWKDPSQIPYRFSKLGYVSRILRFGSEESSDVNTTNKYIPVESIQFNWLTRKFKLGIILYFLKHARKITILNLFHIHWNTLVYAFWYKFFNPKGFVFVKMDNCAFDATYPWEELLGYQKNKKEHKIKGGITERRKKFIARNVLIKKIDLFSVEDDESKHIYKKKYPFFRDNIITSFNGHTIDLHDNATVIPFNQKENIILTVSNLGTYSKATDVLLETFSIMSSSCNWNLHLAGKMDSQFQEHWAQFLNKNPHLKERIIYHGVLDKIDLFKLYNRTKIFVLPSIFEGFANVYSEAMYFGNAIITTPDTSVKNLIVDNNLGLIIEKNNPELLASAIISIIKNPERNQIMAENARNFALKNLNWDGIVDKINREIIKRK